MSTNFLDLSVDVILEIAHHLQLSFPEKPPEVHIIKNLMGLASCSRSLYSVISPLVFKKLTFARRRRDTEYFSLLDLCNRLASDENYSPVWLEKVTQCQLIDFTNDDHTFPLEIYVKALSRFTNLTSLSFERCSIPGYLFDVIGPHITPLSLVFRESDFPVHALVSSLSLVTRPSVATGPEYDLVQLNDFMQMKSPPCLEIHYPRETQTLIDFCDSAGEGLGGLLTKLSVRAPLDVLPRIMYLLFLAPLLDSLKISEVIVPDLGLMLGAGAAPDDLGQNLAVLPPTCLRNLRHFSIIPTMLPGFASVLQNNQRVRHLDLTGFEKISRDVRSSNYFAVTADSIDFTSFTAPLENIVQLSLRIDEYLNLELLPLFPNLQSLHLIDVSTASTSSFITNLAKHWPSRCPPIVDLLLGSQPERPITWGPDMSFKYIYSELDLKWQYEGAKSMSDGPVPTLLRFRCGEVVEWTRQGLSDDWVPRVPTEGRKEEVRDELVKISPQYLLYRVFISDYDGCLTSLFDEEEVVPGSQLAHLLRHLELNE